MAKIWQVYLSGEIHSDWRQQIEVMAKQKNLPICFTSPVTNHDNSDNCGATILGSEDKPFWFDHKGGKLNAIRTKTLIHDSDIIVVRFGEKYKQWNAAFDAGYAAALGKPLITLHSPQLRHALKEVDAAALAVAENSEQIVSILDYVINGSLPETK